MSCHRFGPFTLLVSRRQLFEGSREVRLGARALDLLAALVERAGTVVSKQELMALVWPHEVVEENTLRVHMAALRKALAAGTDGAAASAPRYITNIAGRGYSFVAPSIAMAPPPVDVDEPIAPPPTDGVLDPALPPLPFSLLGRDETLDRLAEQLIRHRLVSLVGPGGIGKTSVAIAIARRLRAAYTGGIWFADLSMLAAGEREAGVARAIARTLGCDDAADGLQARIARCLVADGTLLVLDNCEHVAAATAAVVDALMTELPLLRVLATSREPLRAPREQVHLLPSLPMPDPSVTSLREALSYPAVALFVQRARAADQDFEATDADAVWIAHICQGLDGVPLAIEHAAAMVRAFGLRGLASSLDDRFLLLCGAHRTAISRHQNLEALLSWGYDLLSDTEQQLLRWLSVFRGAMTLSDIMTFASPELMDRFDAMQAIQNLVLKSWLFPRASSELPAYRMHAMARSFAHQKLMATGEQNQMAFRHSDLLAGRRQQVSTRLAGAMPLRVVR